MAEGSTGRADFVSRFGLVDEEWVRQADEVMQRAEADGIEVVRLSFVDQHGVLRGKAIPVGGLAGAFANGCTMTSSLLLKDTAHRTVFPVWSGETILGIPALSGAGDLVMVPDPATFRRLPWSPRTGAMLCDIYFPGGEPVPMSTRALLRQAVDDLAAQGFAAQIGLEVEFHVFKLEDSMLSPARSGQPPDPPSVSLTTHGYQYLTEHRADEMEPVTEIIREAVQPLGLAVRSIEVEFGPSQVEFTFEPGSPMNQADAMTWFRGAVRQVCRRAGYHATFMCRPALPNLFSSGWHLHQSLQDHTGANAFMPQGSGALLSPTGGHYLAGLLKHAPGAMLLCAPTLNGYKRYQPYTMAPDRVTWGRDNKGALLRVIGGPADPGTRIENRAGEPAANPYLYIASQLVCGMAGVRARAEPPPPADAPYDAQAAALPRDLREAIDAFSGSTLMREFFGEQFVDYLSAIKSAEFVRFMRTVTDWEQREYFSNF